MDPSNINFKLLSLNARGIRSFEKRKALFGWLMKDKSDICFLQESYSTPEVEKIWKSQWKGELFFSHGTEHSKGVLILIKNSLEFELKTLKVDQNGRFIILEANVQDHPFLLINLYAPNKTNEQSTFFEEISEELDHLSLAVDCNIVIGGDFKVIFDPDLDGNGGNPKRKESVKCIDNMCLTNDLIDIWRIRNPNVKRFTWRQKTPVIQRRLDFWLVSNGMQEDIDNVDVVPSLKSDHSAIVLSINGIENSPRGPSFWKLNSSLLDDKEYVSLINMKYPLWNDEFKDVTDPRLFWDLMKYRIRQESISYSKLKARERRSKMAALESKLNDCQKMCDQDPSPENMNKFEVLKTEFELQNDYITQGAIIRTRATWYEQGEKSNKYFLNLENSRSRKSSIRKIFKEDESLTSNPRVIVKELHSFFSDLYKKRVNENSETLTDSFIKDLHLPKLTPEQRERCDRKLSVGECFNTLKTFQKNKTPGIDGLTVEFYLLFWPIVGKHLIDCFNYAHEHGELSNSQKQAVITLLEKNGKDKRLIKNWRPISLINVDAKIASKTLAKRLEPILPKLIQCGQNAYVKGRSIFDAVRTIDDILDYTRHTKMSGILVAIDFEKAFDSLDHTYLFKVLNVFNFGPSFIQWIRTLYSNVSSCIINNGFTSDYFAVGRGVRQGDPLSPLLFILGLEILACSIRKNDKIQGIQIDNSEVKLALFADDLTCFLRNRSSYDCLQVCLSNFSECSGLKVNEEKTELFRLGTRNSAYERFPHEFKTSIKILGVHFDYNNVRRKKDNFDSVLKSIKKVLNMWKWRGLTLIGRIQIVKSFAIPKIMSKASLIPVSSELIKEVNKELYSFIWKGKDKVKRSALINDIEDGGLKMLDLESMISAQRVMCVKRYVENYGSPWKYVLDFYLKKVGGKFLFQCNFDYRTLSITLPIFYRECLQAWSSMTNYDSTSYEGIMNQIIWNNKYILSQGKSIFQSFFYNLGILKVGDLVSREGVFLKSDKILNSSFSPCYYFSLMGVLDTIPKEWRSLIKTSHYCAPSPIDQSCFELIIAGKVIDLANVTSKLVYNEFRSLKQTPATAKAKILNKYPDLATDWKKLYSLAFETTLDTKLREFQYKILNLIIFTNKKLHRFKMVDSPLCAFCNAEEESLEHLLYLCKISSFFWKELLSWIAVEANIVLNASLLDILFGKFDLEKDFLLVNHMFLLAKYFIYKCKLSQVIPTLLVLKAKLKATYKVELYIAKEKGILPNHYKKWDNFLSWLS